MAETRDETVKLQGTAQYWQMELDSSDQSEKIGEKEVELL